VKLSAVLSGVVGAGSRSIREALIRGESDPAKLADLAVAASVLTATPQAA
jgi:hypothetical protein